MVDISQLNDKQRWGLLYLMQQENAAIAQHNSTVEQRNKVRLHDQPLIEPKPEFTLETFAPYKLIQLAEQAYSQLVSFKEQEALRLFRVKSPEEQAAILVQLQVPDVLKEDI